VFESYVIDTLGKLSPQGAGRCLPALFKTYDGGALICDTDVNGSYCGARLGHESVGGVYRIAFPHPEKRRGTIIRLHRTLRCRFLRVGDTALRTGSGRKPLMSDFVAEYLRSVPTAWDQTQFIDGLPGQYTVIARSGEVWYVAEINGKDEAQTPTVDLSFLEGGNRMGSMISDGPSRSFVQTAVGERREG
jgi:hypothetical protein